MTSLDDAVRQLRIVIERLDKAATGASRAQVDLEQAHRMFTEAGRGTEHRLMREAIIESRTASEKSGKVARLLAEAAGHFASYVNIVAPDAAPPTDQATGVAPSGEEIIRDAGTRASIFRKASRTTVQKAEQAGDYAKNFADFIDAARPKGATAAVQRPESPPAVQTHATPGDAAQALVVTSAVLAAGALRLIDSFRHKREENRERSGDVPRPDPTDGEG